MSEALLLARAFLSRVAEPASIPVWNAVCERGPEQVVADLRAGTACDDVLAAAGARAQTADPAADLDIAARRGIRLVVPEDDEWPHFAMSALELAGARRVVTWSEGARRIAEHGEPIPPLALWVRGSGDLAAVGTRSVSIVGARSSTPYGEHVTTELSAGLARREFTVVSGGAHGIDAVAHRAALAVGAPTVIVSAGGLDRAYPSANEALFERAAAHGLLVSESPPGSSPQRRRFLTRNRIIAALGSGTIVVEAAKRSGAMNTAGHANRLGRPLMAVPGPVTSTMSVGCHTLIRAEVQPARLVSGVDDVLEVIGAPGETDSDSDATAVRGSGASGTGLQQLVDGLDTASRRVFDSMPARATIHLDELIRASGLPLSKVLCALPDLEMRGLVLSEGAMHRLAPGAKTGAPAD